MYPRPAGNVLSTTSQGLALPLVEVVVYVFINVSLLEAFQYVFITTM